MGLAGPADTEVVELQFSGTRWDIRVSAVRESISRLRALVAAEQDQPGTNDRAAVVDLQNNEPERT
jgi:hypothetical protein